MYTLTPMTNAKYGAYWVLHTNDVLNPVKIFLGQQQADTLDDAIENNGLASMNFGSLPLQEVVIAYRILVQQKSVAPYFNIAQIDDFTIDRNIGTPASAPSSHGALSGLLEDDHTQYYNASRLATYKTNTLDPIFNTKVDKDLTSDTTYPEQTAASVDDDTITFVYIYDQFNDSYKKMALNELYAGANTATGSFVSSTDYSPDGLGANKSAYLTLHALTLNTLAKVYADIRIPILNQIAYFKLPTLTSTNDLEISMNDIAGTYHKVVLDNGQYINGATGSGKNILAYWNGTDWVVIRIDGATEQQLPYTGAQGTFELPKNGVEASIAYPSLSPVADYKFQDLEQLVVNGNFASGVISPFTTLNAGTPYPCSAA